MATGKRFEVKGHDKNGDVLIFGTDDERSAHEVVKMWEDELQDITLTDNENLV